MRELAAVITGTTRIDAACRGALRMVGLWAALTAGQDWNGVAGPTGASTPVRLHGFTEYTVGGVAAIAD
jgi:hypothetical protein